MTKAISLILSIFGVLVTAGLAFAGTVPPKWGLVIGAAVTVAYGVERTLQKILAGATLKSLLSTTEAWGAALTILAALATAITGVVPVHYATAIAAIAVIMLRFGRALQGGAAVVAPPTAGQLSDKPGPRLSSAGPMGRSGSGYDKGSSLVSVMIVLVGAALAILATTRICKAQTPTPAPSTCPQLALCVGSLQLTIQPFTALAYEIVPKTGDYLRGAAIIGVNATTDRFGVPLGVGFGCGGGIGSAGATTAIQCLGLVNVSNFAAVGGGFQEYKDPMTGSAVWQGLVAVAGTLTFGGTPSAFKALAARAEASAGAKSTTPP
jgi:hypothetical protein